MCAFFCWLVKYEMIIDFSLNFDLRQYVGAFRRCCGTNFVRLWNQVMVNKILGYTQLSRILVVPAFDICHYLFIVFWFLFLSFRLYTASLISCYVYFTIFF